MFLGHIGMGLALKRAEPRLNLGAFIFCSLFHLRIILKTVVDLVVPLLFYPLSYTITPSTASPSTIG